MKALERQFQRFLDNLAAHARNVERALDKHQDRFARQQRELEEAQGEIEELKACVASMSDKLCHCSKSPDLKGKGTMVDPWHWDDRLEYHTPPSTRLTPSGPSSITSPPQENNAPVPVPNPVEESSLPVSDQENIPPSCCLSATAPVFAPMSTLQEIKEDVETGEWVSTDHFREGDENRRLVVRQTCSRGKGHGRAHGGLHPLTGSLLRPQPTPNTIP